MKTVKVAVTTLLLLGSLIGVQADTINTTSIDAQLKEIQAASAHDRVKLMNEFKQQLSRMNAQERSEAIDEMRSQMQAHQDTHSEMQEHTQHEQMQQAEQMQHMQQLQEQHAGEQFMNDLGSHTGENGGNLHQSF